MESPLQWSRLKADCLSELIPDLFGVNDLKAHAASFADLNLQDRQPGGVVQVPQIMKGWSKLWHIDPLWRAKLNSIVDKSIGKAEDDLAPTAYGNRDSDTPYSIEYRRFIADVSAATSLSSYTHVARADVQNFGKSVTVKHLTELPALNVAAIQMFQQLSSAAGYPLIHGVRATGRVLNLILHPVDKSFRRPFYRWADEYTFPARGQADAELAIDELVEQLRRLGMTLNPKKTEILPAAHFRQRAKRYGELSNCSPEVVFQSAVEEEDLRSLRYAIPRLSQYPFRIGAKLGIKLLSTHPGLLARFASYLDETVADSGSLEIIRWLIEGGGDWNLARTLPVVIRNPVAMSWLNRGWLSVDRSNSVYIRLLLARTRQALGESPSTSELQARERSGFLSDPGCLTLRPDTRTTL